MAAGSTTISTRQADLDDPADQQAVVELLDMYAREPTGQNGPLSARIRRDVIPGLQSHPTTLVFLALDQAKPVGLAVCFRGFSTFQARPLLNIHDFAVHPDYRGRGVGFALMQTVEREARDTSCCKLTLEVRSDNRSARKLYLRAGFTPSVEPDGEYSFWTKALGSV
jgi:ribosomal protein S18 acetylase RimI-like enzyme